MRLLKLLLFSIFFLFLIITGISLFIPSHVRISRAVNFSNDCAEVMAPIKDMRQWTAWNPFFSDIPPGELHYLDTLNGSVQAMQAGETIIRWKKTEATDLTVSLQKRDGQTLLNGWKCISHPGSDSTTLQWFMDFRLSWYPWEKFASLLFERSYGDRMAQGLSNLQKTVPSDRTSIK